MKNHVAIVLDRSGSMHSIRAETVKAFNSITKAVREGSLKSGQKTSLTYITFSNRPRLEFASADPDSLKDLTWGSYFPDGSTALFDGVGLAIKTLQGFKDAGNADTSFLVLVVTDGEENNSTNYSSRDLVKMLMETQATDRWSYAFQLPPGKSQYFIQHFGIPSDNVREWEASVAGMRSVETETVAGVGGYFDARAKGQTAVKKFFNLTTDLSACSAKVITSKLDDLSRRFKSYAVDKECEIRSFVEAKTGKTYVIGSAYYLLMKPEKGLQLALSRSSFPCL